MLIWENSVLFAVRDPLVMATSQGKEDLKKKVSAWQCSARAPSLQEAGVDRVQRSREKVPASWQPQEQAERRGSEVRTSFERLVDPIVADS